MGQRTRPRRLATSVAWIVAPMLLAVSAFLAGFAVAAEPLDEQQDTLSVIDEIELATARGRLANVLYLAFAGSMAAETGLVDVDSLDSIVELGSRIAAEETGDLEQIVERDGAGSAEAAALLDTIAQIEVALQSSTDGQLELFDRVLDTDLTGGAPSAVTAADVEMLAVPLPAIALVDRVATELVATGRSAEHPEFADFFSYVEGANTQLWPTTIGDLVDDADDLAQIERSFPGIVAEIDADLRASDELIESSSWARSFGLDRRLTTPPNDIDTVVTAAIDAHDRFDSTAQTATTRTIDDLRQDADRLRVHILTIAAIAAIVIVGSVVLALVAAWRRRSDIAALHAQAATDPLTGLANRRAFDELLHDELQSPSPRNHAYFHIDIDCFKAVNDTFGHAAGDAVLVELTERTLSTMRSWDDELDGTRVVIHAARLGGDEFAVAIHGADLEIGDLAELADLLRRNVSTPVLTPAGSIDLTVSIGAAMSTGDMSLRELADRSDAALYTAKHDGRNTSAVADHLGAARSQRRRDEHVSNVLHRRHRIMLDSAIAASAEEHGVLIDELVAVAARHDVTVAAPYRDPVNAALLSAHGVEVAQRPVHRDPFVLPPDPLTAAPEPLGVTELIHPPNQPEPHHDQVHA